MFSRKVTSGRFGCKRRFAQSLLSRELFTSGYDTCATISTTRSKHRQTVLVCIDASARCAPDSDGINGCSYAETKTSDNGARLITWMEAFDLVTFFALWSGDPKQRSSHGSLQRIDYTCTVRWHASHYVWPHVDLQNDLKMSTRH